MFHVKHPAKKKRKDHGFKRGLPKEKKNRRPLLIRDIRFFLNSLDHSLAVMRSAGVDAKCHRAEEGEDLLLTIRIPRARPPAG